MQNEIRLPKLLKHQTEFVEAFDNPLIKYVWYLSGFGGGKTFVGALLAYDICMRYAGIRGCIARDTLVNLKNTSLKTFLEVCPNPNGEVYELKSSDKATGSAVIKFANGSEIILIGLDKAKDIAKLQSLELGFAWADEVDGMSADVFSILQRRLRQQTDEEKEENLKVRDDQNYKPRNDIKHYPRKAFITSNSDGKNWTYDMFCEDNKTNPLYLLVKSTSLDNPHLTKDYVEELLTLDDEQKKRYVYASFDVFAGQIYKELSEELHVCEPFPLPDDWEHGAMLDYGFRNPTGIIYYRVDYDNNIYIYDEYYASEKTPKNHSADIKAHGLTQSGADPSIFNKTQARGDVQYSIADEYMENGVTMIPAMNSHVAGRSMVKQRLKERSLFFFSTCTETFRTLAQLKWAKPIIRGGITYNKEEEMAGQEDHLPDCVRYLCLQRPYSPTPPKPKKREVLNFTKSEGDGSDYELEEEFDVDY